MVADYLGKEQACAIRTNALPVAVFHVDMDREELIATIIWAYDQHPPVQKSLR